MNILSLDVGSTSMRGILFDSFGKMLAQHSVDTPHICREAYREQDPLRLRKGLVEICKSISAAFPVDAVSLTAFRSAPTIVDRDGTPLYNFIMWHDKRNEDICLQLQDQCTDISQRCGGPLTTVNTAPKLTWLRRNHPELYRAAYKAMVVPDYLIHCMSGAFVTDYTYGSRSLLMPLLHHTWNEELCDLFEWDMEKLCTLLPPGSIAATLSADFSAQTGLPVGIPIITAGGDQQCAALGNGILDSSSLLINSGTGAYILSCSLTPSEKNSALICGVSALSDRFLLEASVPSCAAALNAFLSREFPSLSHSQLDEIVRQAYSGNCRDSKAQSALAFYRKLTAQIANAAAQFINRSAPPQRLYISGGLCKSAIYNQILSDTLGQSLYRWRNVQSTSIGAYASAAVTLGLFPDHISALDAVRSWDGCDIYCSVS